MAEVGSYCTHCGSKIELNSKFCPSCGRSTSLAAAQETTTAGVTSKSRPTGVTIVAILNIIGGIAMFLSVVLSGIGGAINPRLDTGSFLAISGVIIAIGILSFVVAYGLLKGRPWGWTLTVILAIIIIVGSVIFITVLSLISIINIIISGIILYYLYRPHVKAHFGKTVSSSGRSSEAH